MSQQMGPIHNDLFGDQPISFHKDIVTLHFVDIDAEDVNYGALITVVLKLFQLTMMNGARAIRYAEFESEEWEDREAHVAVGLRLDIDA